MRRRGRVGARLTRNVEVVGSSPITGPRCYLEQETLHLLLSTGWFQELLKMLLHATCKYVEEKNG